MKKAKILSLTLVVLLIALALGVFMLPAAAEEVLPEAGAVMSEDVITDYGTIPAASANQTDLPFVVFKDRSFVGGYNTWNAVTAAAQNAVSGAGNINSTAVILLRRDFTGVGQDTGVTINAATNITLDLGGYKLAYSWVGFDLSGNYNNAPYKTTITVKNGTVLNTCGMGFVDFQNHADTTAKEYDVKFEGVTFGFAPNIDASWGNWGASRMLLEMWGTEAGAGSVANVIYDGCTFNLRDNIPSAVSSDARVDLFHVYDGTQNANINISINGGNIIASAPSSLNMFNFLNGDANDSLTFNKDADGDYTKLTTASTESYTNGLQYTGSFNTPEGEMYFVEISDDGTTSVCVLDTISFEGGTVDYLTDGNDKHLSAVDFPFFLFKGEYSAGYATWREAIRAATTYADADSKTAYVVMRRDYLATKAKDESTNFNNAKGKIKVDLHGFTITNSERDLIDIHINYDTATNTTLGFASSLEIKNGTINNANASRPIMVVGHGGTNATYGSKQFNFTFTDVVFKATNGASAFVQEWTGGSHVGEGNDLHFVFNDCTFDFTEAAANAVFFNIANSYDLSSAVFNGGKIIASDFSGRKLYNANSDDTVYVTNDAESGKYITLEQATAAKAPTVSFKDKNGNSMSFVGGAESDTVKTYELGLDISTTHGYIPARYSSAESYPFAVFRNGVCVGAFAAWGIDSGNSALSDSKDAGSVILLRRDFSYSSGYYNNLSQTKTNTLLDLNNFTFTVVHQHMFKAQKKTANDTAFTVKNGNIVLSGGASLIALSSWNADGAYAGGNKFDFNFDNVNVEIADGAGVRYILGCNEFNDKSASGAITANIIFNKCKFDLSKANKALTLFDMTDARGLFNVTINGGEIVSSGESLTFNTDKGNPDSSLSFAKADGKYLTVEVPKGASAPAGTFASAEGNLKFKKTSGTETSDIYELTTEEIADFSFVPKASVTLDSNLIFNIYLPANSGAVLGEVTLNGAKVTLGEAVDGYYLITKELQANEAASQLKLTVNLTVNGKAIRGTFTFSTVKYAKKLLEMNTSEKEAVLAKDMLAYVRSAYAFFNGTTVPEIDEVLGTYESKTEINTGEAKKTVTGLTGATFVLDAKPAVRFYLGENTVADFTFKVGTRVLTAEDINATGSVETYGNYVEFSLYAYEMTEVFSYTKGADAGEYNLISYYVYVSGNEYEGEKPTELTDLVAKFYNYCASAKAYRQYVLENQ